MRARTLTLLVLTASACGNNDTPECDLTRVAPPAPLVLGNYRSTAGYTAQVTETEVIVTTPAGQQRYRRSGNTEQIAGLGFDRCGERPETFGYRTLEVAGPKILIRAAPGAKFLSLSGVTSSFRCLFESCPAIDDARVELTNEGTVIEIEQHASGDYARGMSTVALSWSIETEAGTFTESKEVSFVPADEPVLDAPARCF